MLQVLQPHHRFGYEGDVVGCLTYLHVFHADAVAFLYLCHFGVAVDTVLQELRHILPGVIVEEQFLVVHAHLLFLCIAHIGRYSAGAEQPAAQLFVVRPEGKHFQFGQLADGVGHSAFGAEAFERQADNASFAVQRHAGLVAPHVYLLIEVPGCSGRTCFSGKAPVFAVERFPNGFQCDVVLDVSGCRRQLDGHKGIFRLSVIFYAEHLSRKLASGVERRGYRTAFLINGVRGYLIRAGGQPYCRVAFGGTDILIFVFVLVVVGIVRIRMFFILFLISHFQVLDSDGHACKRVGHRYVDNLYVAEQVVDALTVGGACGESGLYQLESHHAPRLRVGNKVFGSQSARNDFKRLVRTGRYAGNHLVQLVEQLIAYDFIRSGQKLQFVASHAVFGVALVVGVQHEGLGDAHTVVLHFDFHFLGVAQPVHCGGTRRCRAGPGCLFLRIGCRLVEPELYVAVLFARQFVLVVRASACHHAA